MNLTIVTFLKKECYVRVNYIFQSKTNSCRLCFRAKALHQKSSWDYLSDQMLVLQHIRMTPIFWLGEKGDTLQINCQKWLKDFS